MGDTVEQGRAGPVRGQRPKSLRIGQASRVIARVAGHDCDGPGAGVERPHSPLAAGQAGQRHALSAWIQGRDDVVALTLAAR